MTDLHYTKEKAEWKKWFASLSDEERINICGENPAHRKSANR